jgi:hypothetical protein
VEKWCEGLFGLAVRAFFHKDSGFDNPQAKEAKPENGLNRRPYSDAKERHAGKAIHCSFLW